MTGFVYPVVVAWTWGNGWLAAMNFKDFAGSGVVHLTGGISGLVGSIIVGPRLGKFIAIRKNDDVFSADSNNSEEDSNNCGYKKVTDKFYSREWDILGLDEFIRLYFQKLDERAISSHSPAMVVLGTLILWLGWLLFNGGSSLGIIGEEGK